MPLKSRKSHLSWRDRMEFLDARGRREQGGGKNHQYGCGQAHSAHTLQLYSRYMDLTPLAAKLRSAGTLTVSVKVTPRSSRNEVVGEMADGTLKIKVAAPPEKGKANAELCAFLAAQFGVPAAHVRIESGATSTRKRVRILE